eukprot:g3920.t1
MEAHVQDLDLMLYVILLIGKSFHPTEHKLNSIIILLVKQYKGVPGVQPARFQEAQQIRHCALSLVGEPIMYPHINEFIRLLHARGISSFLVTNAQFPERIAQCDPVTQLYVSVDASTRESLKKIDRPLFADFWERFTNSLIALRDKKVRTVYRLTLVKGWNTSEVAEYAKLIFLGMPCFIEIKGVTFCGEISASNITMKQVPFHEEVKAFAEALCDYLGDDYELASQHKHSCIVLIAHKSFKRDGKWHTWIDYGKFMKLQKSWYEEGKAQLSQLLRSMHSYENYACDRKSRAKKMVRARDGQWNKLFTAGEFGALDYMAETPAWALYDAPEQGFDPEETRWHRKAKQKSAASTSGSTAQALPTEGPAQPNVTT